MWVSALAYLLSRGWSIYREQVPSRFYSDAHRGEFVIGVLKGMTVGNIWKPPAQPPVAFPFDAPLTRVTEVIPVTTQTVFPVLDKAGKYFGLLHLNQIRRVIYEKVVGRLVIVEDIAVENVEPLHLDTDLSSVMTMFAQLEYPELPVVDADSGKVLGLLRRQDLLAAYNARLAQMQSGKA